MASVAATVIAVEYAANPATEFGSPRFAAPGCITGDQALAQGPGDSGDARHRREAQLERDAREHYQGRTATMTAAARPSAGSMARGLPRASAARYTVPMMVARTADGDMPESRA